MKKNQIFILIQGESGASLEGFSGDPRESSSGRSCRSKSRRWREERANARDEREVTVYGNSLRNANNRHLRNLAIPESLYVAQMLRWNRLRNRDG